MDREKKINIYHLSNKDGNGIFLHPFNDSNIIKLIENCDIKGLYGHEPRIEALTAFSNKMYRSIDSAVTEWLNDTRFIPKFLISSAVFFVSYFFMSFVIRDPLPLIDELVVSLILSVASFILWGRKDLKSEIAVNLRIKLKNRIDKVYFDRSDSLKDIENVLNKIYMKDKNDIIELFVNENFDIEKNIPFDEEFQKYLEIYLSAANIKYLNRKIASINKNTSKEVKKIRYSLLIKSFEKKGFDFYLYILYKNMTYSTV